MGFLRMWTGSDSIKWFLLSKNAKNKSIFPVMLKYSFRDFSFFIQFILVAVHPDPDELTLNCSFQTAMPSPKTRTEWCRSRRSSARTTPPSRGPASGEPACRPTPRHASKTFDGGEELTCTCAPAAVAGFRQNGCERH